MMLHQQLVLVHRTQLEFIQCLKDVVPWPHSTLQMFGLDHADAPKLHPDADVAALQIELNIQHHLFIYPIALQCLQAWHTSDTGLDQKGVVHQLVWEEWAAASIFLQRWHQWLSTCNSQQTDNRKHRLNDHYSLSAVTESYIECIADLHRYRKPDLQYNTASLVHLNAARYECIEHTLNLLDTALTPPVHAAVWLAELKQLVSENNCLWSELLPLIKKTVHVG